LSYIAWNAPGGGVSLEEKKLLESLWHKLYKVLWRSSRVAQQQSLIAQTCDTLNTALGRSSLYFALDCVLTHRRYPPWTPSFVFSAGTDLSHVVNLTSAALGSPYDISDSGPFGKTNAAANGGGGADENHELYLKGMSVISSALNRWTLSAIEIALLLSLIPPVHKIDDDVFFHCFLVVRKLITRDNRDNFGSRLVHSCRVLLQSLKYYPQWKAKKAQQLQQDPKALRRTEAPYLFCFLVPLLKMTFGFRLEREVFTIFTDFAYLSEDPNTGKFDNPAWDVVIHPLSELLEVCGDDTMKLIRNQTSPTFRNICKLFEAQLKRKGKY